MQSQSKDHKAFARQLHERLDCFFTRRYCNGKLYVKNLFVIYFTYNTFENNNTVQHLALNKTLSGTYITDEDLLRLKRCTVWLFSDVCIVREINNKQVFTYNLPLQYLGVKKRSNRSCNCRAKAL